MYGELANLAEKLASTFSTAAEGSKQGCAAALSAGSQKLKVEGPGRCVDEEGDQGTDAEGDGNRNPAGEEETDRGRDGPGAGPTGRP